MDGGWPCTHRRTCQSKVQPVGSGQLSKLCETARHDSDDRWAADLERSQSIPRIAHRPNPSASTAAEQEENASFCQPLDFGEELSGLLRASPVVPLAPLLAHLSLVAWVWPAVGQHTDDQVPVPQQRDGRAATVRRGRLFELPDIVVRSEVACRLLPRPAWPNRYPSVACFFWWL